MSNVRTTTVTTIDGQVFSAHGEIERQTGLEQAFDLFRNFNTLTHIRLQLDNGELVYLNPQHIVSAVISNTEEA